VSFVLQKRIIPPEELRELEALARNTTDKTVYRRLQCVLLRATKNWKREQIAEVTGYSWRQVERIQQAYFEQGCIAFERKRREKAPRQYLSPLEEAEFLHQLEPEAEAGLMTSAKIIRLRFIDHLQHDISLSAVYALLNRQGWSIKQPRPRHPKADTGAQDLFKKTC
jgi:transposase